MSLSLSLVSHSVHPSACLCLSVSLMLWIKLTPLHAGTSLHICPANEPRPFLFLKKHFHKYSWLNWVGDLKKKKKPGPDDNQVANKERLCDIWLDLRILIWICRVQRLMDGQINKWEIHVSHGHLAKQTRSQGTLAAVDTLSWNLVSDQHSPIMSQDTLEKCLILGLGQANGWAFYNQG